MWIRAFNFVYFTNDVIYTYQANEYASISFDLVHKTFFHKKYSIKYYIDLSKYSSYDNWLVCSMFVRVAGGGHYHPNMSNWFDGAMNGMSNGFK